jgi:nitrate reductase alpha subunit
MGGVACRFYDWYCDLPPASPEIWGEQTDVAESADWFHSKFIATVGSNVLMTRTPDAHFLVEARHKGTKWWFSPRLQPDLQGGRRVDPHPPGQPMARSGWPSTT